MMRMMLGILSSLPDSEVLGPEQAELRIKVAKASRVIWSFVIKGIGVMGLSNLGNLDRSSGITPFSCDI